MRKILNIYKNEEELNKLIILLKTKTRMRSPQSINKFKEILNKVFIHLKIDIDSYKTVTKEDINYTELINLVHDKHICYIHHILRLLFNYNDDELKKIVVRDFNYDIKPEDVSPDYINTDELNLMYSKANDLEKLILYLFMSTGMRLSAVANIHSIDYKTKTFLTLEKYNKEIRYNIVSPLIENLFKSTNYYNKKRAHYTISKIINNLKIKCGLENSKHIHPHAFRHTFAKMNLYSGVNINTISKMLNHSDSKITETTYLKERVIDVVNRTDCPFMKRSEFIFVTPQIWIDLKNNGY